MTLNKTVVWWTAGLLAILLTAAGVAYAVASNAAERATVLQVVDGDTLDVDLNGERTRVRLLNVDTPETKHPHEAVQCLGPEAAEYLEEFLPAGTVVELEYDVEREDRYGRTLAGVFHNDTLVNAQIAAQGLGVAVKYEPNDKFYDRVKAAEKQARSDKMGLFDPNTECTLPQQVENLLEQVNQISDEQPQDRQAVDAELEALGPLMTAAEDQLALVVDLENRHLHNEEFAVLSRLYSPQLESFKTQSNAAISTLESRKTELEEIRDEIKAEEERRRAEEKRKKEEQERKEKEERERQEAEAAERQRQQEIEEERRRQAEADAARPQPRTSQGGGASDGSARNNGSSGNPAPKPKPKPKPAPAQPKSSSGNNAPSGYGTDADYPGYTGPRCYAPGGQSWRPC